MGLKGTPPEKSFPCAYCENECPLRKKFFGGYFIASTDKEDLEKCLKECGRCTFERNGYNAKMAAKKVGVYYKELNDYVVVNDNASWNELRPLTREEADEIHGG